MRNSTGRATTGRHDIEGDVRKDHFLRFLFSGWGREEERQKFLSTLKY
jgi:hypothetical protein